jgi:hypothetical protein
MTMHPDIDGMEFDWFGTDCAGNIALFATAGAGFVPKAVVSTLAEHESISNNFDQPHWGSEKIWDDYASLGLFVFDWNLHNGPYQLMRTPAGTISSELHTKVKSLSALPRIDVDFHSCKSISESELANDA